MIDLHKFFNRCILPCLLVAVLMAATTLYVILNEFTHIYSTVTGAF